MKTSTTHPLLKEIQLGKSPEELVREHFVGYDFQGDVYDQLPDIVREIVRIGNEHLRFAVALEDGWCGIVVLGAGARNALTLDYWNDEDGFAKDEDANLDCEILNEIVERLYGIKRKKPKPKLTNEQFARKKGNVCPYCGGGGATVVLDDVTWNNRDIMGCLGCGETWSRDYKIVVTGFSG